MNTLDSGERLAVKEFLGLLEAERFEAEPQADPDHIVRGPEGQIIVPVRLRAAVPSLSLALLMGQKAEHLYKRTGCRLVLAQCPVDDPKGQTYVWKDGAWRSLG
jgi:hypothetical protein